MLTDKEIEDIALKYTRLCGGHWEHEEAMYDAVIGGNDNHLIELVEKGVHII